MQEANVQKAVERAIRTMWNRYDERLSLDDMAHEALLSRFYFTRVFREVTGTSPFRFLTAIRLYQAKHLLLETSMRVTAISYQVGYNSPGTFTSRFTRSVGVSPARYRLMSRAEWPAAPAVDPTPTPKSCAPTGSSGTVHGSLTVPSCDTPLRIYVAAFDSPIVQGLPGSVDVLESTDHYCLRGVPSGKWYVRAAAVATTDVDPRPWTRRPLFVADTRALTVRAGQSVDLDVSMRPTATTDLPILLALPELDSWHVPEVDHTPASPRREAVDDDSRCATGIVDRLTKFGSLLTSPGRT